MAHVRELRTGRQNGQHLHRCELLLIVIGEAAGEGETSESLCSRMIIPTWHITLLLKGKSLASLKTTLSHNELMQM